MEPGGLDTIDPGFWKAADSPIRPRLAPPRPDLAGLNVLVVGMGESGQGAADLLCREKAVVTVYDSDAKKIEALRAEWEPRGVKLLSGRLEPVEKLDFCVVSPGVPPFGPFFTWLRQARIPLLGELELACRFLQRAILAVTGTNGKTTVTHMIRHILNRQGIPAEAVGNVGYPVSRVAAEGRRTGGAPLVMEVSSYQCETMEYFRPAVAVVTNLAPDHLDRYNSVREYYETKFRMCINQAPDEALWLGPMVEGNCPRWVRSQKMSFAVDSLESQGLLYQNGSVVYRDGSREESHSWPSFANYPAQQGLNALAAAGASVSYGIPLAEALHAIESFQALPHRLEFVKDVKGIRCYNDSKATNVHAVEAALKSLPGPVRLIAGGQAKGDSLDPLTPLIRDKVRAIYLIGEAAETFARAWRPLTAVHLEATLEAAVDHALRDGAAGEILLLSPACASWDMFKNYADRGDRFKRAVEEWNS